MLQARYLYVTKQTQNKRTQTSFPRVGFEPTGLVSERANIVHALDRASTLIVFFSIRIVRDGVQSGSTRHVDHFWPIAPATVDCEDAEFCGIKIGRGNRSTGRKPAAAPLCPPQILLYQTRPRTRAAAVGIQRLTARDRLGEILICLVESNNLAIFLYFKLMVVMMITIYKFVLKV
jgi:hypothetical protein